VAILVAILGPLEVRRGAVLGRPMIGGLAGCICLIGTVTLGWVILIVSHCRTSLISGLEIPSDDRSALILSAVMSARPSFELCRFVFSVLVSVSGLARMAAGFRYSP
jgi:hypothetical protein